MERKRKIKESIEGEDDMHDKHEEAASSELDDSTYVRTWDNGKKGFSRRSFLPVWDITAIPYLLTSHLCMN